MAALRIEESLVSSRDQSLRTCSFHEVRDEAGILRALTITSESRGKMESKVGRLVKEGMVRVSEAGGVEGGGGGERDEGEEDEDEEGEGEAEEVEGEHTCAWECGRKGEVGRLCNCATGYVNAVV